MRCLWVCLGTSIAFPPLIQQWLLSKGGDNWDDLGLSIPSAAPFATTSPLLLNSQGEQMWAVRNRFNINTETT